MVRRGGKGRRGSSRASVRNRVVGSGSVVGAFLALGLSPLAGAPIAHADFDDALDAALGSFDSMVGGLGSPGEAGADALGGGGVVTALETAYNNVFYGPLLELSQRWASSPIGAQVDELFNASLGALFGQDPSTGGGLLAGLGSGGLFGHPVGAAAATGDGPAGSTDGGLTGAYTVTSQWNNGFTANYVITNTGTTPLTNWQAQFDMPAGESVSNMWNANYTVSDGHYLLTPESYDNTIAPGQSVTVGFQGADNGTYTAPAGMSVSTADSTGTGSGSDSGSGGGSGAGTGSGSDSGSGSGSSTGSGTGTGTGTGSGSDSGGGSGSGSNTGTGSGSATGAYTVTSQWNNGYTANYVITNTGTTPLTNWQAQFDLPAGQSISNMWNAHYVLSDGHYVLTPQNYDATIAPGQSVTIGYQAADNGTYSPPTDMSVNGHAATTGADGGSGSTGSGSTGTGTSTGGGDNTGTGTGSTTGSGSNTGGGTNTGGGSTTPPSDSGGSGTGVSATSGDLLSHYSVTDQWNGGYTAAYTITNTGTTPLTNWQATFDLPAGQTISNLWGGNYTHAADGSYVVTGTGSGVTLQPGQTVTVGFQANDNGSPGTPTDMSATAQPAPAGDSGGSTGSGGSGGTNTPPPPPSGDLLTQKYGLATIGDYFVQNNDWNGSGQQLNVTPNGFTIAAEQGNASTSSAPLAYPSMVLGCHYSNCSPETTLPEQVSHITSATSSIDYSFPTNPNAIYDASYDIWLNPTAITNGVNQQEVMIWFNHQGPIQPVGHVVEKDVDIDGKDFDIWQGYNGQNYTTSFVADSPITSWNNFNILDFITQTEQVSNSGVDNDWYLTSIQAGYEPWNSDVVGGGINSFSANVK